MAATIEQSVLVHDARDMAQRVLGALPQRWRHSIGVARRAEELAATVPCPDLEILIAAAWLHDIGYAEDVKDTGFHPLDGGRYLAARFWPPRVGALVAHHSGSYFQAEARGLDLQLGTFPREQSAVSDALAYADQTVGPTGDRLAIGERIADMLRRHGPDSVNARVHHVRGPYLLEIADRVERRLSR
jgi:putative nucleotidyltransferase with HDIG domain